MLPDFILDRVWRHINISYYISLCPKAVIPESISKMEMWLEARIKIGIPMQSVKLGETAYYGKEGGMVTGEVS